MGEAVRQQLSVALVVYPKGAEYSIEDAVGTNRSGDITQHLVHETVHENSPWQIARSVIAEVLYTCNDIQTLNGQSFS